MNTTVKKTLAQGQSLEKQGDLAQAASVYQNLLRQFPDDKRIIKRLKAVQRQMEESLSGVPGDAELGPLLGLFNSGQVTAALTQALALARKYPEHAPLANMLGVIYSRLGRVEDSLAQYGRALYLKPQYPEAFNNMGNVMMRIGRTQEAVNSYREALKIKPDYPEAHNGLGNVLHEQGDWATAEQHYKTALDYHPDYAEAANNLGNLYKDLNRPAEAIPHFEHALRIAPRFSHAHCNLGNCLRALGDPSEAEVHFLTAIELDPGYANAYAGLANALNEQGRIAECLEQFSTAIRLNPQGAGILNDRGNALSEMGDYDAALDSYQEALVVSPEYAQALGNIGITLAELGRYDEASENLEAALRIRPDFAEAHYHLSRIKTYEAGDPHIAVMQERLGNGGLPPAEAVQLNFSLGKAMEDLGEVDRAFEFLAAGNRIRKQAIGYDIREERELLEEIKRQYDSLVASPFTAAETVDATGPTPIFIVGLPRSGTTLTEQILASHSQVYGAGELKIVGQFMTPLFRRLEVGESVDMPAALASLRERYTGNLEVAGITSPYVTDKMPANFKWIGFLLQAFPNARIINLQRDFRACCWSMFKIQFRTLGFTNDLRDLAMYCHLYDDMMTYWRERLPGRIFDLDYELLTSLQETQSRKLVKYCGLEWEAACLDFHKVERAIRTASDRQVRQKIYKGSSEAWRAYEAHLQPLLEVLEDDTALSRLL